MLHSSSTRTDKTQFSSLAWRAARALFLLAAVVVLATLLVPQAMARDVSAIKSIDMRTGIVTAVEKTTGRSFQFTVHDQALLKTLRVGQPVYADFDSSKVSIDGIEPCCNIITKFGPVDSAKFGPVDSAIPCCNITGMDASGTVAAVNNATGQAFQFQVNDSSVLNSLHLGQSVNANFNTSKVAIYGGEPCCQITSAGATSALRRADVSARTGAKSRQQSETVQQQAGSSPAATKAALASEESDLPGIRMELQELKRTGQSVTVKFTLFNDSAQRFALAYNFGKGMNNLAENSIDASYLVDPLTNTNYPVMTDSQGGCVCSRAVPAIAPKSKAVLWAKFALPAELQSATVVIPRFAPVEDVPISSSEK